MAHEHISVTATAVRWEADRHHTTCRGPHVQKSKSLRLTVRNGQRWRAWVADVVLRDARLLLFHDTAAPTLSALSVLCFITCVDCKQPSVYGCRRAALSVCGRWLTIIVGGIIPSRRLFCFAGPASTKAGRARVWRRSPRRTASLPKARAFARFHACAHSPLEFEDQVATSPPTAHRPASDHHAHRRVTIDSVPATNPYTFPPSSMQH